MWKAFKNVAGWIGGFISETPTGQALLAATLIMAVILLALNVMGPGL